ncbi:CAP domain-containing protein [Pilaira anomala]|nr:CAP domain-containing protein [Pilaira anomala]
MFGVTLAVLTALSTLAVAQNSVENPAEIQQSALNTHNGYRARHHVPGIRWSDTLAAHAKSVSDSCVWGHNIVSTGQNIGLGYSSMQAAVDSWYNEVSSYNYDNGESTSSATSHFTQIVWKETTEIGCAATYCANLGASYYVCDYSPPGNFIGQYSANVLKP